MNYWGACLANRNGARLAKRVVDSWPPEGPPQERPWAEFGLHRCRDGRLRPVEPETLPMAHGIPDRVAQITGYGNAIVPQVGAEFIVTFAQACRDMSPKFNENRLA